MYIIQFDCQIKSNVVQYPILHPTGLHGAYCITESPGHSQLNWEATGSSLGTTQQN